MGKRGNDASAEGRPATTPATASALGAPAGSAPTETRRGYSAPARIAWATVIGLALYAGLYLFAELLVHEYGHRNPFYKVAGASSDGEYLLIAGASHALPFTYDDMNAQLEERLGLPVLNLATTGGGVVPNYLLLDYFLRKHGEDSARLVVYVLDSFAFYSPRWNEERLRDAGLWQRAPLDAHLARSLWQATRQLGVPRSVLWNYLSAFSKLNDPPTWFEPDLWPDEAEFDQAYTPSQFEDQARIDYLYSEPVQPEALGRYETLFTGLARDLEALEVPLIVVSPPLRDEFLAMIPGEAEFRDRLRGVLDRQDIPFYDLSATDYDESLFLDPDHLNRSGVLHLLDTQLEAAIRAHLY